MPISPQLPWYLEEPGFHNYGNMPWVGLDLETTNRGKGDPRDPRNSIVLSVMDEQTFTRETTFSPEANMEDISSRPYVIVCHNAKFELGWMLREGIPIKNLLVWDTMIGEYVLAGNRQWDLSLGATARRYGLAGKDPAVDSLMTGGVCPSEIPEHWLGARCRRDVETTLGIAKAQYEIFKRTKLGNVFFTRCIVTPVLASIEAEGMALDHERVREEYARVTRERAQCASELRATFGEINFRSGKQVGALLYDTLGFAELTNRRGEPIRTSSGARATDSDTLERLVATTKDQRTFKNLRAKFGELDARLTKNLEFFYGVCKDHGGKFYGNFNQCVTQTHRLSSSGRKIEIDGKPKGVQFQNMPRDYKRLFRASEPGWKMVEIDGAQLEFRVAGILGVDSQVCKDVVDGADIHRYTASVIHKKPESEVTKAERTAAKAETFAPLYGAVSGSKDRQAYIEAFRKKYSGVYKTQQGWVYEVLRDGTLETPWGLRFYWPGTTVDKSGYIKNSTSIFNYPIQSFATADIIPVSMVYLFWNIKAEGIRARIVNTIHDSTPTECHPEDVDRLREVAIVSYLDDTYKYIEKVYGIEMKIPLGIGFISGEHWGEGEEQVFSRKYKEILNYE